MIPSRIWRKVVATSSTTLSLACGHTVDQKFFRPKVICRECEALADAMLERIKGRGLDVDKFITEARRRVDEELGLSPRFADQKSPRE